jgi:hypothetical protein
LEKSFYVYIEKYPQSADGFETLEKQIEEKERLEWREEPYLNESP